MNLLTADAIGESKTPRRFAFVVKRKDRVPREPRPCKFPERRAWKVSVCRWVTTTKRVVETEVQEEQGPVMKTQVHDVRRLRRVDSRGPSLKVYLRALGIVKRRGEWVRL